MEPGSSSQWEEKNLLDYFVRNIYLADSLAAL
jgi:hypothetical protein